MLLVAGIHCLAYGGGVFSIINSSIIGTALRCACCLVWMSDSSFALAANWVCHDLRILICIVAGGLLSNEAFIGA